MQWMVPKNKLGQAQLDVLDRCLRLKEGRVWIQGFAGSGKTVLLVHAIREALAINPKLTACVLVYTHSLKDLVSTGLPEHLILSVPVMTYHHFLRRPERYDLILVDEVQDLEGYNLKRISGYASRLIMAGDSDQSIYGNRLQPGDIERLLSPEKYKLEVIYRLTETLKMIVQTILPHSQIEAARVDRMAANVDVRLGCADNFSAEVCWVWREASKFSKQGDPVAILLPKKGLINRFIDQVCAEHGKTKPSYSTERSGTDYQVVNQHLQGAGLGLRYLGSNFGRLVESDERPVVYLMTYHSAKGLDFDTVFLPHLDDGMEFWTDDEGLSRRMFFVATTRSRRNLFMSYHGASPHRYVQAMPQNLLKTVAITPAQDGEIQNVDIF